MTRIDYPFRIQPLGERDGGGYLIEFPDLPGCMSDGETPEEAITNGADALRCWIEARRADGEPVPAPSGATGKWVVSLPDAVYRRLRDRADAEGVSTDALAAALLQDDLVAEPGVSQKRAAKRGHLAKA